MGELLYYPFKNIHTYILGYSIIHIVSCIQACYIEHVETLEVCFTVYKAQASIHIYVRTFIHHTKQNTVKSLNI